jgi:hypothetical protein
MIRTEFQSPVTGQLQEDQVILDFGKYEGRSVQEVSELDHEFYEELAAKKEHGVFAIRKDRDRTFRLYINPLMDQ